MACIDLAKPEINVDYIKRNSGFLFRMASYKKEKVIDECEVNTQLFVIQLLDEGQIILQFIIYYNLCIKSLMQSFCIFLKQHRFHFAAVTYMSGVGLNIVANAFKTNDLKLILQIQVTCYQSNLI